MSSKMEQIKRAKIAGQRHNVHVARTRLQHHHASHVGALKFDEQVGMSVAAHGIGSGCGGRSGMTLSAHKMLPACGLVLLANDIQLPRVIHPGLRISIEMDGHAVEFGDRVAGVGVPIVDKAAGYLQHGPVKGKVGMEGGRAAELLDAGRNPVGGTPLAAASEATAKEGISRANASRLPFSFGDRKVIESTSKQNLKPVLLQKRRANMPIAALTIELRIEHAQSLKDRRQVVRSLKEKLAHGFNISVAELDEAVTWRSATIGVAAISGSRDYLTGLMRQVEDAANRIANDLRGNNCRLLVGLSRRQWRKRLDRFLMH